MNGPGSDDLDPDEPIVGVKVARLVTRDGRFLFAPRYPRWQSQPYGTVADAVCESDRPHPAPATDCRCGFYAVATRDELWRLDPSTDAVVLDVELAGAVIEHEFGWRAAHQAVLGIHLPRVCGKRRCGRDVSGAVPMRRYEYALDATSWTSLRPVCRSCGGRRFISIADLAGAFGVEVTADSGPASETPRETRRRIRKAKQQPPRSEGNSSTATALQWYGALGIGDAFTGPLGPFTPPRRPRI